MFGQKTDRGTGQETQELTRRDFLKGSAIAGGALTAAGVLAACAPNQGGNSGSTVQGGISASDVSWDREADVVVVGFGGAGGAAAIEAAEAGASVIVVEMTATGGGSTVINGGYIMMGGTALQGELGIDDSTDEFAKYLAAAAGGSGDAAAWEFMAKGAPELYDWCVSVGMEFAKTVDMGKVGGGRAGLGLAYSGNERARQFAAVAKPAPRGHIVNPEGNGQGFFRPLTTKAQELGCEFVFNTTAEHLVLDDDGRVVGVSATDGSGKTVYIKANKGVCLTAGGFGVNTEMVQAHYPHDVKPAYPTACPQELGIGINMGLEIGADTYNMSAYAMGSAMYGSGENETASSLKGILVSPNGQRIVAEDEYYAFVGKAIIHAQGAFLIVDDPLNTAVLTERPGQVGEAAAADTIEGLATAIGIPPASLAATLSYYNAQAANGADPTFGKHEEFLVPLATPPYHALYNGPETCYYHTCGGLRINLDAQVLNLEGQAIPGLYAAGRNSNIAYGYYVGSGSSMLDVFTFGRIAGKNAAAGK
jgi:3-oxo-5alpha-steroid 4-dehydrogenase